MAGLIKNKKAIERGLKNNDRITAEVERTGIDSTEPYFNVQLPNIYKTSDGVWEFDGLDREFDTYEEFQEYAAENEEFYQLLKERYPAVISTIWKSAFSKFYGGETVASKMLHGGTVDYDALIMGTSFDEYSVDTPTINYILTKACNKFNKHNPVSIKPYKKAKKEVMSMLGAGSTKGYFLPEITENGVVVTPTKFNKLSARFFAVEDGEYTEEQVREYLTINADYEFSDEKQKALNIKDHVDSIIKQSRIAYESMMTNDMKSMRDAIERMNIDCSYLYAPDFSVIEQKETAKKMKSSTAGLGDTDSFDATKAIDDTPDYQADDTAAPESYKERKVALEQIVIEGDTKTRTRLDSARGTVTLVLTNDGGLYYETSLEENGRVLRATPVSENNSMKEKF